MGTYKKSPETIPQIILHYFPDTFPQYKIIALYIK